MISSGRYVIRDSLDSWNEGIKVESPKICRKRTLRNERAARKCETLYNGQQRENEDYGRCWVTSCEYGSVDKLIHSDSVVRKPDRGLD